VGVSSPNYWKFIQLANEDVGVWLGVKQANRLKLLSNRRKWLSLTTEWIAVLKMLQGFRTREGFEIKHSREIKALAILNNDCPRKARSPGLLYGRSPFSAATACSGNLTAEYQLEAGERMGGIP
jgi:hypothetical protein